MSQSHCKGTRAPGIDAAGADVMTGGIASGGPAAGSPIGVPGSMSTGNGTCIAQLVQLQE
jgi:hypothetical protein